MRKLSNLINEGIVFKEIEYFESYLQKYKKNNFKKNTIAIRNANRAYYLFENSSLYLTLYSQNIKAVELSLIEIEYFFPGNITTYERNKEQEFINYAFKNETTKTIETHKEDRFILSETNLLAKILRQDSVSKEVIAEIARDIRKVQDITNSNNKIYIYNYILFQLQRLYDGIIKLQTFKNYIYTLNKHVFSMIENLNNIKDFEIAAIMYRFENRSYTKESVDNINRLLKHFFIFIKKEGFFIDIPALLYPKSIIFENEIDKILLELEKQMIYNNFRQSKKINFVLNQQKALILIAFYTGLRKNEIRTRLLRDVYFYDNTISIDVNKDGLKKLGLSLKTKNSLRRVEATIKNEKHLKILKEWWQYRQKLKIDNFLFLKVKDNKIYKKVIDESIFDFFNKIIRQITKRYATFHSLRHSFATYKTKLILENKKNYNAYDFIELCFEMGHQTPDVTINRYVHFSLIELMRYYDKFK